MRFWMVACVLFCAACGGDGNKGTDDAAKTPDAGPTSPDAALGAPTTTAAPPGGTWRTLPQVTLTADRASTIYYTTDGTAPSTTSPNGASPVTVSTLTTGGTLRFFAAPTAGPNEAAKTENYVVDRLGPVALDGFTATVNGADVELAWTNPTATGFTDVVVARSPDVGATFPSDGTAVAVGDTVGPAKVIYAGPLMAFKDVAPGAGGVAYVAWARYRNTAYAEGRTTSAYVEPAAQVGQIVVDTTAGTATVATQPSAWSLATANYAVDPTDATKISFDVTATSALRGVTFTPKLVSNALTAAGATATLTPDGKLGTSDVVLLGPAVAMGGAVTRKVSMVVSAPSTVTYDFTVRHDRAHYWSNWARTSDANLGGIIGDLVSTATRVALPLADRFLTGRNTTNANGAYRDLVVSADGRWLYAGQRSSAHVVKIDTTTGLVVAGLDLTTAATRGSIQIALDPSGRRLYATLNDGMHIGADRATVAQLSTPAPTANSSYFLELDTKTMTEQARIPMTAATDPQHVARQPVLSRDGRAATFPLGGPYTTADTSEIALVDLSKFALRDANLATAGQQNVATGIDRPTRCVFSWTADRVLCTSSTQNTTASPHLGDHVLVLDTGTMAMTVADGDGVATTNTASYKAIVPRPDGKVWVLGDRTAIEELDPATRTFTVLSATSSTTTLAATLAADGASVLVVTYRDVRQYSTTDGALTILGKSPNNRSFYGHTMAMSPF